MKISNIDCKEWKISKVGKKMIYGLSKMNQSMKLKKDNSSIYECMISQLQFMSKTWSFPEIITNPFIVEGSYFRYN